MNAAFHNCKLALGELAASLKLVSRSVSKWPKADDVRIDKEAKLLNVAWTDRSVRPTASSYPFVWLRDNCQCPKCFDASSQSRIALLRSWNLDLHITDLQPSDKGIDSVRVRWSDGHDSLFELDWLKRRTFCEESRLARAKWQDLPVREWGSEMQGRLPTMEFESILTSDVDLYNWLVELESGGIICLKNAPKEAGQLDRIAKRVAFLRTTHYGVTSFVRKTYNPSNVAFTGNPLNLHTDLSYYYYVPGMQMLHCLKQTSSEGGANELVDGFRAARRMKEQHPLLYKLLTEVELTFYDRGNDYLKFHTVAKHPIIKLDGKGKVEQINYSNHSRDSYLDLPLVVVPRLYEALKRFDDQLYDPSNMILYKLVEGDILCFHNYRILHGRTKFEDSERVERVLEAGYIDWDEMRSRRRVLMEELGIAKPL